SPPAFLGCGQRIQVHRWLPIFGGIVFRAERTDRSRGLVGSECLTKEFVDLLRSVHLEGILAVYLLEQGGVWPVRELLNEERGISTISGRIGSLRRVAHLVRIDGRF